MWSSQTFSTLFYTWALTAALVRQSYGFLLTLFTTANYISLYMLSL